MQLRVSRSAPWHSSPPLRGAGSEHSRLRQWVQSSPQADHLLHGLQLPSTIQEIDMGEEREDGVISPERQPQAICQWL